MSALPKHGSLVDGDLLITFWGASSVRFKGTRAQLEAEGVVGPETIFPTRDEAVTWEREGLEYRLQFARPHDARGPRRVWCGADCWALDVTVPGRDWRWAEQRRIEELEAQLRAELHRQTPAGRREADEQLRRYVAASLDKDFRAFKRACMLARATPTARQSLPEER